jgi:predicted DNA-binding protein (UPF0251 family)
VADIPSVTVFKPQGVPMGQLYGVAIGLDGFEALRLVDAEGLSQEEAAARMGVSRPTLCRILGEARTMVARALSRGWAIRIELGGDHAVRGEYFEETTTQHCQRAGVCAGGVGQNQGESSCQDREDKVAVEARVADAVRAADAEGSGWAPELGQ